MLVSIYSQRLMCDACNLHRTRSSLFHVIVCRLLDTKPTLTPVVTWLSSAICLRRQCLFGQKVDVSWWKDSKRSWDSYHTETNSLYTKYDRIVANDECIYTLYLELLVFAQDCGPVKCHSEESEIVYADQLIQWHALYQLVSSWRKQNEFMSSSSN